MNEKILDADADADIRDMVAFKLEQSGFEVIAAEDGAAALEAAREHRPALCVLDVMMPGLSGVEVTREIRHDRDLADMKITLLTARAQEATSRPGSRSAPMTTW